MSDGLPENSSAEQQMAGNHNRSGFVVQDTSDLVNVCRRLGITGPLEPLMRELTSGRTHQPSQSQQQTHQSHNHHQHRKTTQSRSERKSLSATRSSASRTAGQQPHHQQQKQYFDDGTSEKVTYGQESWGRDSGARDLSPAEQTSSSCRHPRGGVNTDIDSGGDPSTSSMIHLANKVSLSV